MATSLRGVCAALGRTGSVSLCSDILGFFGHKVPAAPNNRRPVPVLKMNEFVRLLRGRHFHVHLIFTGSDLLNDNDRRRIDYEVFRLRDIYTAARIGIGIVTREERTTANSAGHARVLKEGDVARAGHDITADGDFIPVVVPAVMDIRHDDGTSGLGLSPPPPKGGPCSPRNAEGMNSSVIDFDGDEFSRTLAHEVGHFLGADHPSSSTPGTNLMAQNDQAISGDPFFATTIIESDRNIMLAHCVIRPGLAGI